MSFLNKILLLLYKHYRKKNDSSSAAFHSKGIIVVLIFMNILTMNYIFTKIGWTNALVLPRFKIGMALVMFPIFLVVNYFTYSDKELEENIDYLIGEDYKNVKFITGLIFVISFMLLLFLPTIYGGLED
jgi:hypothetical protein